MGYLGFTMQCRDDRDVYECVIYPWIIIFFWLQDDMNSE